MHEYILKDLHLYGDSTFGHNIHVTCKGDNSSRAAIDLERAY